jgi:alpha-tubulin suppressor-like RCC1 family protein
VRDLARRSRVVHAGTGGLESRPLRAGDLIEYGLEVGELAGGEHSLALTSAGLVLAWGDNIAGELGDGTTTDRHVPVFAHLPQGAKVRGLFGGCFHTLALTTAGQVLAWGDNQWGQLGDGTTTERDLPARVAIQSGTTVTAISAGCDHNLAATSNGHVLAWGIANDGELGIGTQPPVRKPYQPTRPAPALAKAA